MSNTRFIVLAALKVIFQLNYSRYQSYKSFFFVTDNKRVVYASLIFVILNQITPVWSTLQWLIQCVWYILTSKCYTNRKKSCQSVNDDGVINVTFRHFHPSPIFLTSTKSFIVLVSSVKGRWKTRWMISFVSSRYFSSIHRSSSLINLNSLLIDPPYAWWSTDVSAKTSVTEISNVGNPLPLFFNF